MLHHPNIIAYYDSFVEDKALMIVMEYAEGGTIFEYLQSRDSLLEEEEILQLFVQMVLSLQQVHNHNILHRDLKTQNIMLDKRRKVDMRFVYIILYYIILYYIILYIYIMHSHWHACNATYCEIDSPFWYVPVLKDCKDRRFWHIESIEQQEQGQHYRGNTVLHLSWTLRGETL